MTAQTALGRVINFLAGSPARRFASISVVLAIVASIAPTKDLFSEWRYYQRQYKHLIRQRPDGARLQKNFQVGIQQIWIPERHVTDRCPTCHVALQENSLADQRNQPFRPHAPMPHTLNEFGCVICHNGQGAATTVSEAHYSTKAWEQPILPTRYLEASCGQCHMEPLEGTPQLNLGRRLLARYGCAHCHAITQPDGSRIVPVDEPPSLEHVGEKTSREWIFSWLKNPQAYAVSSTMPNFRFSDQEATDIANYLVAQSNASANSAAPSSFALPPAEQAVVDGPGVYGMLFCASCHATQNSKGALMGGELAPEITRVGSKVKVDWLQRWLKAPQGYDPKTRMPRYRFDDKQIAILTAYLLTKKDEDLLANVHLSPSDPQSVDRGKKLATDYGCAACHRINGIAPPEGFAPDLSRIGSKPLFQVGFLRGMPETLPDYISGKIRDPRAFGPALKMPRFTLDDGQVEALTTALLAQTDRAVTMPPELLRSVPRAKYRPGGDTGRLMEDLRCQSCHSINGNGGDMAPELTREGSAVQRAWLLGFMKNPDTLRPALIRRMPKFNLTNEEIRKLSDYMLNAYQVPGFDSEALDVRSLDAGAVARGRELFYVKFACQACHIADYKKDKGYVGPALADVGDRLTPVWMYKWLKDPNAVVPGTAMPNPRLADKEAKDLTAFLVTLKIKKKGGVK